MAAELPLDGRTALVTGASRGIGLACARLLVSSGARVLLLARGSDALSSAAEALGPLAHPVECDLGDPEAVTRAAAQCRSRLNGEPDIVVHCAGELPIAPVEKTELADFERVIRVALTAAFALVREFLPAMRQGRRGHVVVVGSLADRRALPGNAAYAAGKFGVRGLLGVLREELRDSGVRATLVSPTHVDTAMWDSIPAELRPGIAREHMLQPEAVARAVLFALTAAPDVNVDEIRLSPA
jgi:NADP-dependent 3-hydroxy acid dehydrogenase YdfG